MLLLLFGLPGVGKSFIGKLLANQFNLYFYDADSDLTPSMHQAISQKDSITQEMRDEYYQVVCKRISYLQTHYENIVIAQALAKEKNRLQLLTQFPKMQIVLVTAHEQQIKNRLMQRNDWVDIAYAERIKKIFEPTQLPHSILNNDHDESHIIKQVHQLLPEIG